MRWIIVLSALLVSMPTWAKPIDKSMQPQRQELIQKLIAAGVFQKIEVPGSLPRVWVMPRFYQATFDEKQEFISVVYAYYFDDTDATGNIVRIYDSLTGKEVGDLTSWRGLRMF